MGFINEKISQEDFAAYDLDKVNKRMRMPGAPARQWTIDRSRNYWLRQFYARHDHTLDNPGFTGMVIWDLFLDGMVVSIETQRLKTISSERNGGIYFSKLSITNLEIPADCLFDDLQVLGIFKEAQVTYAGVGIYSEAIGCEVELVYKDNVL